MLESFESQLHMRETKLHKANDDSYNLIGDRTVHISKHSRRKDEWLGYHFKRRDQGSESRFMQLYKSGLPERVHSKLKRHLDPVNMDF